MTKTTVLLLVLGMAAACGKEEAKPAGGGGAPEATGGKTPEQLAVEKENAAPVAPKPKAPRSDNDVDLTFSGAFSATLKGKAGSCSLRKSGPMPGATWQVRSEELGAQPPFNLTIISETAEFDDPSMVVNVTGDGRTSYARHRGKPDARLVVAKDATSAELDVEMKEVVGGRKLRVVGTIKCSKPDVFE